jgi:hypothetical protein
MLLHEASACTLTRYQLAIPLNVSPWRTTCQLLQAHPAPWLGV